MDHTGRISLPKEYALFDSRKQIDHEKRLCLWKGNCDRMKQRTEESSTWRFGQNDEQIQPKAMITNYYTNVKITKDVH